MKKFLCFVVLGVSLGMSMVGGTANAGIMFGPTIPSTPTPPVLGPPILTPEQEMDRLMILVLLEYLAELEETNPELAQQIWNILLPPTP